MTIYEYLTRLSERYPSLENIVVEWTMLDSEGSYLSTSYLSNIQIHEHNLSCSITEDDYTVVNDSWRWHKSSSLGSLKIVLITYSNSKLRNGAITIQIHEYVY